MRKKLGSGSDRGEGEGKGGASVDGEKGRYLERGYKGAWRQNSDCRGINREMKLAWGEKGEDRMPLERKKEELSHLKSAHLT